MIAPRPRPGFLCRLRRMLRNRIRTQPSRVEGSFVAVFEVLKPSPQRPVDVLMMTFKLWPLVRRVLAGSCL